MNWFRENRWLGTFLIVLATSILLALYFLFRAKSGFEDASARLKESAAEKERLDHLNPFPNGDNYRKTKEYLENYGASLNKLKDELKGRTPPVAPLAPNEFQSRLRQVMINTSEKARANRVRLPDNFHLGFDEFTAALPNTTAAPLLGQELAQVELLMNILIDARVDSVTVFKRVPLPPEKAAATTPTVVAAQKPAAALPGAKMFDCNIVDLTFSSAPSAARKVLNQIASSEEQFFIVRTLRVHNEQEKGPSRESIEPDASTAAVVRKPAPSTAIQFIVGNEHIEIAARIEMVRFIF